MKKLSIISLALVISLLIGCTGAGVKPESIEDIIEEEQVTESSEIEFDPEPPIFEEEESSEEESSDEESVLAAIEPDTGAANTKPIKEVEALSDEYVKSKLSSSIEELNALDNNSIVWGPGYTSDEVRPSEPLRLQEQYGSAGAYFLMPSSDKIYLSFDEGYEVGYTAPILDALKESNVKAVFFVTLGYVKSSPDLVQRMIDEGHIVGNHSCTHPVGGMPTMEPLDIAKDILYLHEFVLENFGYEMSLFRPPEGTFSQRSLAVLNELGYKSVFWSFAYRDWELENQPSLDNALDTIVSRSHPGAIYLLHAVSSTNATVLSTVVDRLQEKGYQFSDWSELV